MQCSNFQRTETAYTNGRDAGISAFKEKGLHCHQEKFIVVSFTASVQILIDQALYCKGLCLMIN